MLVSLPDEMCAQAGASFVELVLGWLTNLEPELSDNPTFELMAQMADTNYFQEGS